MSESARESSLCRLEAIADFQKTKGGITAAVAAERLGLKISRFYKMAADWKSTNSLASLGTIPVKRSRRTKLKPEIIAKLNAVVPRVVAMNADLSVARLVDLMVEEAGVDKGKPSKMKLREIVEAEKRRVEAIGNAGNSIAFDCCALSVARDEQTPFVLFAVLDRGTRAWLGYSLARFEEPERGYADAASHAASRLADLDLPWAKDVRHLQITAGEDLERFETIVEEIIKRFAIPARRASNPKRFGGYLREIIGPRIGPIEFASRRTVSGPPINVNGSPAIMEESKVREWIDEGIAEHNRIEVARSTNGMSQPPVQLIDVLGYVASLAD